MEVMSTEWWEKAINDERVKTADTHYSLLITVEEKHVQQDSDC